MSANPEAFDFVRKAAYAFVQKNGKDSSKLYDHCAAVLGAWRNGDGAGSGLTDTEAADIVANVHHWMMTKFNIPRRRAARSREQRAAEEMAVTFLYEESAELHGTPSVRKAARLGGKSKTTVARHLRQQGIAPVRQKKIAALRPLERRLVAILDETFPRDGAGLVLIDELAAALWDGRARTGTQALPEIARSTKSTRRKNLKTCLAAISGHGLGFHAVAIDHIVAVRRGRRFHGVKDTAIWVEDEKRLRGVRTIRLPEAPAGSLFWDDPWLADLLDVLRMGLSPHFTSPADLEPLLRLARPVIDTRPLYPWFARAINRWGGDFLDNLRTLSDLIVDPAVQKAVRRVAGIVDYLRVWAQYGNAFDYFDDADREIKFMNLLRDIAPESYARFGYVRDRIFRELESGSADSIHEAIRHCERLREKERSGDWHAPAPQELAFFHPANEPPF